MIRELEKRQHQILERDRKLAEEEHKNREDRRILDLTRLKLKQVQHEISLKDYSKLKSFVRESRSELENLVRELREGEITKEKTRKVKEHIAKLDNKLEKEKHFLQEVEDDISNRKIGTNKKNNDLIIDVGSEVKYNKNNKNGIVVEQRRNNQWLVAFGNIKLSIDASDLIAVKNKPEMEMFQMTKTAGFTNAAVFELDLRGMRVYEAEAAMIKQIDSALLSGLNEFSIIHGLGEGILSEDGS